MKPRPIFGACMNLVDDGRGGRRACDAPAPYRHFEWLLCPTCKAGTRQLSAVVSLVPWPPPWRHDDAEKSGQKP